MASIVTEVLRRLVSIEEKESLLHLASFNMLSPMQVELFKVCLSTRLLSDVIMNKSKLGGTYNMNTVEF